MKCRSCHNREHCQVKEARHKRPHTAGPHLNEIPRRGKSIEREGRLLFPGATRAEWGVTANGHGASPAGHGQVLKLIMAVVLQPYEYTKNIELCASNGGILQDVNFIPKKLFFVFVKERRGQGLGRPPGVQGHVLAGEGSWRPGSEGSVGEGTTNVVCPTAPSSQGHHLLSLVRVWVYCPCCQTCRRDRSQCGARRGQQRTAADPPTGAPAAFGRSPCTCPQPLSLPPPFWAHRVHPAAQT